MGNIGMKMREKFFWKTDFCDHQHAGPLEALGCPDAPKGDKVARRVGTGNHHLEDSGKVVLPSKKNARRVFNSKRSVLRRQLPRRRKIVGGSLKDIFGR